MTMKVLALLMLSSLVSACGDGDNDGDNGASSELQGRWVTDCYDDEGDYTIDTNIFTADEAEFISEVYFDSACSTLLFTLKVNADYSIGADSVLGTGETVTDIDV